MDDDLKLSASEMIVMSLTAYIIFSIIMQTAIPVNPEMEKLFSWLDYGCSIAFLTEWCVRFRRAENRIRFTYLNIVDLLASLPVYYLPALKAWRLVKLFQIVKLIGSISRFSTYCRCNKIQVAKLSLFILFALLMLVSPVLILYFESAAGSINTAENALWWTYCTITTIGYGDLYPITTEGRLFTVFVSLGGIGVFGILSSLVINYIVNVNNEKNQTNTES